MTKLRLTSLSAAVLAASLTSGCALFSSDNTPQPTPLQAIQPLVQLKSLWSVRVDGSDNYAFSPAIDNGRVYAVGQDGRINVIDAANGRELTQIRVGEPLTGGIGVRDGRLFVTTAKGELLALTTEGVPRWRTKLTSLALAAPQVGGQAVLVQTGDGNVTAFSFDDGHQLWSFQRQQPALTVRNYGSLNLVGGEAALLGQAGGRLAVLNVANGEAMWEANVASARGATELDRVADVASRPVFDRGQVCAVAFQGRVTCFDARGGTPLWSRELSSSRGLTLDAAHVYVTADDGTVQAFDRADGRTVWKQDGLRYRGGSAPVMLGRFVLVADGQGVAHLLSNESGELVGRLKTGLDNIKTAPISDGERVLVQDGDGHVAMLGL